MLHSKRKKSGGQRIFASIEIPVMGLDLGLSDVLPAYLHGAGEAAAPGLSDTCCSDCIRKKAKQHSGHLDGVDGGEAVRLVLYEGLQTQRGQPAPQQPAHLHRDSTAKPLSYGCAACAAACEHMLMVSAHAHDLRRAATLPTPSGCSWKNSNRQHACQPGLVYRPHLLVARPHGLQPLL